MQMSEETAVDSFTEDAHLDLSDGPKPIVPWDAHQTETTDETEQPSEQAGEVADDPGPEPQVFEYPDGSSVTIESPELTGKGWRATADSGTGKPAEVFYGATKDQLLQNVLVGKLNATKKINELKRAQTILPDADPEPQQPEPIRANRLNADEVFDLKAKLEENPDEALEQWHQRRTGKLPEEVAATAEQAFTVNEDLLIDGFLKEWVADTPDYVLSENNYQQMVAWLMKFKLGVLPTARNLGLGLIQLYRTGKLTERNLSLAWADLKANDLVDIQPSPEEVEVPQQPVNTTTRPRGGFGVRSSKGATMQTRTPVQTQLTAEQLERLSDEEIRQLYQGVLDLNRTPEGKQQIQQAVQKIRERR
jgi:hypothetical protein